MNETFAKVWALCMFVMVVFAAFLGNGWLIGVILGLIIGFVKYK